MTDFPCPAEVVDPLGKRLPEGARTLPDDIGSPQPHPVTDGLEDDDD